MPEAKGLKKRELEQAMDRLYRAGVIERGFLYRDTAEGKDIEGLREVTGKPPETPPETSRKELPEGSGNPQKSTGNTVPYINISGAAPHGSAAPVYEQPRAARDFSRWEPNQPSRNGHILAPGETEDDPVPGWE